MAGSSGTSAPSEPRPRRDRAEIAPHADARLRGDRTTRGAGVVMAHNVRRATARPPRGRYETRWSFLGSYAKGYFPKNVSKTDDDALRTACDDATKAAFEEFLGGLRDAGVEIYDRSDDPAIEAYEQVFADMPELWRSLYRFEFQWPMLQYKERYPEQIPPRLLMGLKEAEGLSQAEYREALNRRVRIRDLHRQLSLRADAFITLSSPGPGPVGIDQGSAVFNEGSSVIGMPALSLPLMAVDNVPVGIQILGQFDEDERLTAIGRWIAEDHFNT